MTPPDLEVLRYGTDVFQDLDNESVHLWRAALPVDGDTRSGARQILQELLRRYLDLKDDRTIDFELGENGKPRLPDRMNARGLSFNISHTGNQALLGFALQRPIGVDIEADREPRLLLKIAEQYFSKDELEELKKLGPEERMKRFMRLWSGTEAVIKAFGGGVFKSISQTRIAVRENGPEIVQVPAGVGHPAEWTLQELSLEAELTGMVCYGPRD